MMIKGWKKIKRIRYLAWMCSVALICCLGKDVCAGSVSSSDIITMRMLTVSDGDGATVSGGDSTGATEQEENISTQAEMSQEIVLILPTRLDFVIDPWEISGPGQLYSSVFMVQNVGDTPGWLNIEEIKLECGEDTGVVILTEVTGIRDNTEKNIYMEMHCNDGNVLIMSEEGQAHRVWLEPGEKFEFEFKGSVNQQSELEWKAKDVSVHMVYSWEKE